MVKKNLIGIVVVMLVAAAFVGGYMWGKSSGPGRLSPFEQAMAMSGGERSSMEQTANADQATVPVTPQQADVEDLPATVPADLTIAQPVSESGSGTLQPATTTDGEPGESEQAIRLTNDDEQPELQLVVTTSTALPDTHTFYGTAAPSAEVKVQSTQGGTIIALKGKEGDLVQKGDVLVRFDDSEQRLEIETAKSSRNTALAQVSQAESQLKSVQTSVDRNQKLFKEGLISQQEMDDLLSDLETAQVTLNSANEAVKQADTEIALLERELDDFVMRAPINGIIDEKNYNLQEIYSANDVLYHLINIDRVYVNMDVPETYIKQVREGMQVSVIFNALGDQTFSGVVETILPSGTTSSRNFTVKVLVDNPDHAIKSGMFASVEIAFTEV